MACGEKWLLHTETGSKSNADTKRQRGSQWFLWQFRNLHIPQRDKESKSKLELLAEQKCNQLQPDAYTDAKTGASAKPTGRS